MSRRTSSGPGRRSRSRPPGHSIMVEDRPVPTLRYVVADVFTDVPLAGNQLAVFTDGRDVDAETMRKLAREINFSETVFVLPPEAGGHARIRIFTPAIEDRKSVV